MLGIIFTGGESPPPEIIRQELKETKLFVVAADSGLIAAEDAGIKPDYIVGDMDSIAAERLKAYSPDCVIYHKTDKDYTDTELAFSFAVEKGCKEIWIIGGGGGRIDHLFAIRSLFEREIFPCRWITEAADIRCIDAAFINELFCSPKRNALVSIFPLGAGPWKAVSTGLKWPLDDLVWDRGFFGLSNTAVDGDFFIKAEKGRFMAVLPI